MTIDEALKVLDTIPTIGEQVDALEMAIGALKQEPCDCISRQAVLDAFEDTTFTKNEILRRLLELPPVTPQPKIGEWLEKEINSDKVIEEWQSARCNVCGRYHTTPYMYYFSHYDYCPHCGCRMKGESE